jgi:hypothetical protein
MSAETFTDDTLEHRCPKGHGWREHGNGQVTPSWGLGGTFIDVEDSTRCPEPAVGEDGMYQCATCRQTHRPGDGVRGMSCTPWEFGPGKRQECQVPEPACGLPAVWTRRWGDRYLPWPNGPGQLYSLWHLSHRCDGERLVAYLGGTGNGSQVLDLHTGEPLTVEHGDLDWVPTATRPATVRDLPEALCAAWPRHLSSSEAGGVSTPWLLAHTNPDYIALCELHANGMLRVRDHEREFMWAVMADSEPEPLEHEIRARARDRDWQVDDVDALLTAHARLAQEMRAVRVSAGTVPGVQLALGV